MEENARRPGNVFQLLVGWLLKTDYLAVHASIALSVLFSLISFILILSFFERTSVPEILYLSFFILSFSFEVFRLILPIQLIRSFPSLYLITVTKILFFVRFLGMFSLFTTGICAAGLDVQRTRIIIIMIIIASLACSMRVPIDAQTWDTCFNFATGFTSMFIMVEVIAFIATAISFLVAVKIRRSNDYFYVGAGLTLALFGRNILFNTDNWAGPIAGILFLSFGTWLMCSKLHRIHLWL